MAGKGRKPAATKVDKAAADVKKKNTKSVEAVEPVKAVELTPEVEEYVINLAPEDIDIQPVTLESVEEKINAVDTTINVDDSVSKETEETFEKISKIDEAMKSIETEMGSINSITENSTEEEIDAEISHVQDLMGQIETLKQTLDEEITKTQEDAAAKPKKPRNISSWWNGMDFGF